DVIYTVDFFTMDGHQPAGTISYFPAHDGLPAAWQTKHGFWAVAAPFNETFEGYLPSHDGGTSALWYILPGAGLGLVAVAGGLGSRRLRSLRRPSAPNRVVAGRAGGKRSPSTGSGRTEG